MGVLERIYYFHREVAGGHYPKARAISEKFEVSLSTAHRDIAYLRDRLGAPLVYDRERQGFFYENPGFTLPLDNTEEILTIFTVVTVLAKDSGLEGLPEMQKLRELLGRFLSSDHRKLASKIHCERVEVYPPRPEILRILLHAVQEQHRVRFSYRNLLGRSSHRMVDAYRLISYQGRWYLLGFCHLRRAVRIFQLARISRLEDTKDRFAEPGDDVQRLLENAFGIFKSQQVRQVRILFTGTAAAVVRGQIWHGDQEMEEMGEGVVMKLPVADFLEIKMKVLQFGSQAKVLDPAELRKEIADEIQRMSEQCQ